MAAESFDVDSEISPKHRVVAKSVIALIVGSVLLGVIAYLGRDRFTERPNPTLEMGLMILVLFLGLGSIAWRRTKFSGMRLQDIGALEGPRGLLRTLEKTTLQLSMFGAAISILAFLGTLVTGNPGLTYRGIAVALVVLLYSYPTKSSWNRVVLYYGNPDTPSESNTVNSL